MATVTLNLPAEAVTRIGTSLEYVLELKDELGDPRSATVDDYKNYIIAHTKQFVRNAEQRIAAAAADSSAELDIT